MIFAHMHLMVADLERSVRFYVDHFRFKYTGTQIIEEGRFITEHWMAPGTTIAFVRDHLGAEIALERTGKVEPLPAWFHFGFLLSGYAEVEELYGKLCGSGVRMRKLTREGECLGFRCYDPDGYLLEFCYVPGRISQS